MPLSPAEAEGLPARGRHWLSRLAAILVIGIVGAVVLCQVRTDVGYARIAGDLTRTATLTEIPGGSGVGLLTQARTLRTFPQDTRFIFDAITPALVHIVGFFAIGHPLTLPSFDPYGYGPATVAQLANLRPEAVPDLPTALAAAEPVCGDFIWSADAVADRLCRRAAAGPRFRPDDVLITPVGIDIVLNAGHYATLHPPGLLIGRVGERRGHLFVAPSAQTPLLFMADLTRLESVRQISLWSVEPDYFYPGRNLAGLGPRLLMGVIQPVPGQRLKLDLSTTLLAASGRRLPPVRVVGQEAKALGLVGRGSARIFSAVVEPQVIEGESYLGLDLGVAGQRPSAADIRYLTAFVRDISLVDDEHYLNLKPPSHLAQFPADLADPQLEYSGLYEDGWVAEDGWVRLQGPTQPETLLVQGTRAPMAATLPLTMTVSVDEQALARFEVPAGDFAFRVPLAPGEPTRKIALHFDRVGQLPPGDERPAAIRLLRLGWGWHDWPRALVRGEKALPLDPSLEASGIWSDGWVGPVASVTLAGGAAATLHLEGTVVAGLPLPLPLEVVVNGQALARPVLAAPQVDVRIPLPPSAGERVISLHFAAGRPLAAPDTRVASLQLRALTLDPPEK